MVSCIAGAFLTARTASRGGAGSLRNRITRQSPWAFELGLSLTLDPQNQLVRRHSTPSYPEPAGQQERAEAHFRCEKGFPRPGSLRGCERGRDPAPEHLPGGVGKASHKKARGPVWFQAERRSPALKSQNVMLDLCFAVLGTELWREPRESPCSPPRAWSPLLPIPGSLAYSAARLLHADNLTLRMQLAEKQKPRGSQHWCFFCQNRQI